MPICQLVDVRGTAAPSLLFNRKVAVRRRYVLYPRLDATPGRVIELGELAIEYPARPGVRDEVMYAENEHVCVVARADRHDTRSPSIEVCKDRPYRVTGAAALFDAGGDPVVRNAGNISHATYLG